MDTQSPLDLDKTFKRLQQGLIRYNEVSATVNSLAHVFQSLRELQENRFAKRADMVALLPELLLIRALTAEGLALAEQIVWDASMMEEDDRPDDTRAHQELGVFLQKIVSGVWATRPFLEGVEKQVNTFQQAILASINTLDRLGEEVTSLFQPKDLIQIQRLQKIIRTLRGTRRKVVAATV